MIKYALKCEVEHEFEAWFASSDGYDDQVRQGLVECPLCGSVRITKAIMAPRVHTSKGVDAAAQAHKAMAEALYRLRKHVETTHDYVGASFATEARDMHQGLTPGRPIYGEATHDEVKSLVEDGVPVAAIPVFTPPVDDVSEIKAPTPSLPTKAAVNPKLN